MTDRGIIEQALAARSLEDVRALETAIVAHVGAEYRRPLGDAWNNFGLMSHAGDFDHKVIENVTNAQDAVLERLAAERFGPDRLIVPFGSPREAADALIPRLTEDVERRIAVDIYSPGDVDLGDKRITFCVRDDGCGMTAAQMPHTILQLGSSHKSYVAWQQGAFGLGAKSTFRNARAVVIVSRRAPEMADDDSRIAVAVVRWDSFGKGLAASYLTTTDWDEGRDPHALPWSAPASVMPGFGPGTYISLVSYQVRGFHRRFSGDERAFHAVAQTRLPRPVIPFRHTSHLVAKPEPRTVRGVAEALASAVAANPDLRRGRETLPFHIEGTTYQLPIDWFVFPAPANKPGGRNSLVASGHVVVFTSAGQTHHHWDQATFKDRTRLNKLDGRVFVLVGTDELPIEIRTRLFTPDRSALLPNDDSIRLESAIAALLDDPEHELAEINSQLLREEIEKSLGGRGTRAVAQKISRAFAMRGFSSALSNGSGRRKKKKRGRPHAFELLAEPTTIEGPEKVILRPGDTRSITYWINAVDAFARRGGRLEVICDHPQINAREIAVGELHDGRARVTLAVPDQPELGEFTLTARIPEWPRVAGGIAGPISLETAVTMTDEPPKPPKEPDVGGGASRDGGEVALVWTRAEDKEWGANVPGSLELVPAATLSLRDEYKDLRRLGDLEIPTIFLSEDYSELKKYLKTLHGRRKVITVERTQDKYAQGVGVGLLVLNEQEKKHPMDDDARVVAVQAIARATLSLLPEFDNIAGKIGDLDLGLVDA